MSGVKISIVIFSCINFFTRPPFNPWGLPPSLFLYCPRHLQVLLLNVSALEILAEIEVYFMEGSVPTIAAPREHVSCF